MHRCIPERRKLRRRGIAADLPFPSVCEFVRKAGIMDMEFFQSWTFMGIMVVLLIVLIGVLLFLRSKRPED
jgi:hypothetical protein